MVAGNSSGVFGGRPKCMSSLPPKICQQLNTYVESILKKRISTPDVEIKNLRGACRILIPEDSTVALSAHERPSCIRPFFDTHVHVFDSLYSRYKQSTFLSTRYPCEQAMRFACTIGSLDILISQLDYGYGKNAQILAGDPRQTQDHTFIVIEASVWPLLLDTLIRRGVDLNVKDDRGRTALSHVLETHRFLKPGSPSPPGTRQTCSRSVQCCLELLLKAGVKRAPFSQSVRIRKITSVIAKRRWIKVRRLCFHVRVALSYFRALYTHVHFKPGGLGHANMVLQWSQSCIILERERNRKRGRPNYEVDPADYHVESD